MADGTGIEQQSVGRDSSSNNLDLRSHLSAYIITNGRSTFPYCIESVKWQKDVVFDFYIIRDMSWLDANQSILRFCQTPYFLRVDDDMLLHPLAIRYMWESVKDQPDGVALEQWKLWESYSERPIRGIKIYTYDIVKSIGFRVNHLGKIDKCFREDCSAKGYDIKTNQDMVGIHSCSDNVDEHVEYAKMRGEDKGKDFKKKEKSMKKLIHKCPLSMKDQLEMTKSFLCKKNKKYKTDFTKFIDERKGGN